MLVIYILLRRNPFPGFTMRARRTFSPPEPAASGRKFRRQANGVSQRQAEVRTSGKPKKEPAASRSKNQWQAEVRTSGKPKKEPVASRKANGKPKMGSNDPPKSCSRTCRADLAVSERLPSFAGYFPLAPTGPAKQLKKQPLNPTSHESSDHPLAFLQRPAASDFRCRFSCKSRLDPLDAVELHPALDCNHFPSFEPDRKTGIPPTPSVARGGTSRR